MQLLGHRRRRWNWQRLLKKARGSIVAVLASVPLLLFICCVYVAMLFERLFSRGDQRMRSTLTDDGARNSVARRAVANEGAQRTAILGPVAPKGPGLIAKYTLPDAESGEQRALAEAADQARQKSESVIASNLQLCRSPAAIAVIVEEAIYRRELHWRTLEVVFARFIDVNASSDAVRSLMRICAYEWLYEMQIEPRRFIRLKPQTDRGRLLWHHAATRLICFEFNDETSHQELLPTFDGLISQDRIFFYFDRDDQLVGWERPRRTRRRHL